MCMGWDAGDTCRPGTELAKWKDLAGVGVDLAGKWLHGQILSVLSFLDHFQDDSYNRLANAG